MSPTEARLVAEALTAGQDGCGADIAPNACEQAADELNILMQAIHNGATSSIVCNVLSGIEFRLRAAAGLNAAICRIESEAAQ